MHFHEVKTTTETKENKTKNKTYERTGPASRKKRKESYQTTIATRAVQERDCKNKTRREFEYESNNKMRLRTRIHLAKQAFVECKLQEEEAEKKAENQEMREDSFHWSIPLVHCFHTQIVF